jgi:hypothetical protein
MVGSYRHFNLFRLPRYNAWSYSGTYFWFRNKDVFARQNWNELLPFFATIEAWPGVVFKAHEVSCLFFDNVNAAPGKNMYSHILWQQELRPRLTDRKIALEAIKSLREGSEE